MTTLLRPRLLAMLFAALLFTHYGCEPLDTDMQGDSQADTSLDETQGSDDAAPADTAQVAQPKAKSPMTTARMDTLEAQMRDTRDQVQSIRRELDDLKANNMQEGASAPSDPQGGYKTALEQFFNHQYEEAAGGFRKILDEGKPADMMSNSQYWIGECEYGMHQYKAAITSFRKVFNYSSSTKYDDAQMMLGMSYLRLNNKARAKKEFKKLIEQYPESEFVPRAKRILSSV